MKEEFLHYVWRYGLYHEDSLSTISGFPVRVLHPGQYNRDTGPDFRQAKIKMGQVLWIGDLEIHVRASDWYAHEHHLDPAYNGVILHVVAHYDRTIKTLAGTEIPTIRLSVKPSYYDEYIKLLHTIAPIPCHPHWQHIEGIYVEQAIVAMGVERMEDRMTYLKQKLKKNRGGWKELFFQVFARAFGFGKYQENFNLIAQSLPVGIIERHQANLFQLESLLLGQSGLLPERSNESYPIALLTEYRYLSRKYHLKPNKNIIWRQRKTRPANSPTLRLAQLAAWLHDHPDFFNDLIRMARQRGEDDFCLFVSSYWKTHYHFEPATAPVPVGLGQAATELIMINAVLPLNAFYCSFHGDQLALEEWMEQTESIASENNQVIRLWKDAGLRVPNAFYSQSLLYIYQSYCVDKKCIRCRLGQSILRRKNG